LLITVCVHYLPNTYIRYNYVHTKNAANHEKSFVPLLLIGNNVYVIKNISLQQLYHKHGEKFKSKPKSIMLLFIVMNTVQIEWVTTRCTILPPKVKVFFSQFSHRGK